MGFNSISKAEQLLLNQTLFCPYCGKQQMFHSQSEKKLPKRFICAKCGLDFKLEVLN